MKDNLKAQIEANEARLKILQQQIAEEKEKYKSWHPKRLRKNTTRIPCLASRPSHERYN